jgi:trimeric autotransporter adhesin
VMSIDLSYALSDKSENGNLHAMVSSWTASDGSQHDVADVYFAKEAAPGSTPITLGDVLAPPAAELLGSGAPTPIAHAAAVPIIQRSLLDDELNKHNLLI